MIPDLLDIASIHAAYRDGALTPVQLCAALLDRIDAYADQAVFISRFSREEIVNAAAKLDLGQIGRLPLFGIPCAVKDNIDVAGIPTTAACPAFAYTPKADAFAVAKLRAAGAIILGKTNLDQFATGLNGTRSPFGAPRSVFHPDYISGGSSSGSAVAVGAGLACFALGTDTAGSGRVPAGINNLIGLKPTIGRLSATGVVPACKSLDCISIFANSAADALAVLTIAEGFDPADIYSREPATTPLPATPVFGTLLPEHRDFAGNLDVEKIYDKAIQAALALGWTEQKIDYAPSSPNAWPRSAPSSKPTPMISIPRSAASSKPQQNSPPPICTTTSTAAATCAAGPKPSSQNAIFCSSPPRRPSTPSPNSRRSLLPATRSLAPTPISLI
jgi:allophanate hydrolase